MARKSSKVLRVFGDSHSVYDDNDDFVRNVFVLFDDDSYEWVKMYITDRESDKNKDVDNMIYEMGKHLKGKTKNELFKYIDKFPDSYMDEYKKYYQKLSEEIMKTQSLLFCPA